MLPLLSLSDRCSVLNTLGPAVFLPDYQYITIAYLMSTQSDMRCAYQSGDPVTGPGDPVTAPGDPVTAPGDALVAGGSATAVFSAEHRGSRAGRPGSRPRPELRAGTHE